MRQMNIHEEEEEVDVGAWWMFVCTAAAVATFVRGLCCGETSGDSSANDANLPPRVFVLLSDCD